MTLAIIQRKGYESRNVINGSLHNCFANNSARPVVSKVEKNTKINVAIYATELILVSASPSYIP